MNRGGQRTGAGRPSGSKNKSSKAQISTLSELAKDYAPEAIAMLAEVMRYGMSDSARVAAASAILDRAFGRPKQVEIEPQKDGLTRLLEDIQSRGSKAPIATQGVVTPSDAPLAPDHGVDRVPHTGNQLCLKISEG